MVNAPGFNLLAIDASVSFLLSRFNRFASYSQVTLARFSFFAHTARGDLAARSILPLNALFGRPRTLGKRRDQRRKVEGGDRKDETRAGIALLFATDRHRSSAPG